MEQCVAECKNHNFDSNTLLYIPFFQFLIGTADYYVSGVGWERLKSSGGGHMNFHVASSVCWGGGGLSLTFATQQGGLIMF